MDQQRRPFKPSDLVPVKRAADIPGTRVRLQIGDKVTLNSGSQVMLVVDFNESTFIAAAPDGHEYAYSRSCLTLQK